MRHYFKNDKINYISKTSHGTHEEDACPECGRPRPIYEPKRPLTGLEQYIEVLRRGGIYG